MPIVHGVSLSPFVRKVQLVLECKGVEYELNPVIPINPPTEYLDKSPLGKVPCYEDDDIVVPDSSVICQYLEEIHPEPAMYPAGAVDRARARWFEEYGDTKLIEVLGPPLFFELVVKPNFLDQPTDQERVDDNIKNAIPPVFDYLESQVPESGFMFGSSLGIADIALGCPLLNARYAEFEVDAGRWPKFAAYAGRVLGQSAFERRAKDDQQMMSNPPL